MKTMVIHQGDTAIRSTSHAYIVCDTTTFKFVSIECTLYTVHCAIQQVSLSP